MNDEFKQSIAMTVRAAETVFHTAMPFDVKSGETLPALSSSALQRILQEQITDRFPNDSLMQILLYVLPAVKAILKTPRQKMVKQTEMVSQSHLRGMNRRTMSWLSKRPGRTAREKIASSPHILTEKKQYTADTPENRAFSYLIKCMSGFLGERVQAAQILQETLPVQSEMPEMAVKLCEFGQYVRSFHNSVLSDVPAQIPHQANNALISDKHYKKIWKAILRLKTYAHHPLHDPEYAISVYTEALTAALCARLYQYQDIRLADQFARWRLCGNQQASFFPMYLDAFCDDGTYREIKITCSASQCITVSASQFCIADGSCIRRSNGMRNEISIRLYPCSDMKPESGRGMPIRLTSSYLDESCTIKKEHPMYALRTVPQTEIYADCDAIQSAAEWILTQASDVLYCTSETVGFQTHDYTTGNLIMDFSTQGVQLYAKQYVPEIAYSSEQSVGFLPGERCLYGVTELDYATMHTLMESDSSDVALDTLLDAYAEQVGDHCFAYLVPDDMDEFEQRDLRKNIRAFFPSQSSFPVWRSVAAAEFAQHIHFAGVQHEKTLLVIDVDAKCCPVTELKLHQSGHFEHFVPVTTLPDDAVLSADNFAAAYLKEYASKYAADEPFTEAQQQRILADGKVHDLLRRHDPEMKHEVCLRSTDGIVMMELFIDLDILDGMRQRIQNEVRQLMQGNVRKQLTSNPRIMIICSRPFLTDFFLDAFEGYELFVDADTGYLIFGANRLCERYLKKEITWHEHLPRLEFLIPKNGHYSLLPLVGSHQTANAAAVSEMKIQVHEMLVLPAGQKSYEFPLMKENLGRRERFVCRIRDASFPLQQDALVHMEINYRYGSEDTYELMIRPEGAYQPFREITAEWVKAGGREKENAKIRLPEPVSHNFGLHQDYEKSFEKVKGHLVRAAICDLGKEFDWLTKYISFLFKNTRFLAHAYMRLHDEKAGVMLRKFVNELGFYYQDVVENRNVRFTACPQIYNEKSNHVREMRYTLAIVESIFGAPDTDYFECLDFDKIESDRECSFLVQYGLMYHPDENRWRHYMQSFASMPERRFCAVLRSMSVMFWMNPETLDHVYQQYPDVLLRICDVVQQKLQVRNLSLLDHNQYLDFNALRELRDMMETLFAILRLRHQGFHKYQTGGKEAMQLADQIKLIDHTLYALGEQRVKPKQAKHSETVNVLKEFNRSNRVQLEITPPDFLRDMSSLCYTLLVYLTGELGSDTIHIKEFKDNPM